jgi:hypothetical protein
MSVSLMDSISVKKTPQQELSLDKRVEEINGMPTELNLRNGITYIGSEKFCKERFQLSCTVHSASHMDQVNIKYNYKIHNDLLINFAVDF